MTTEQNANLSQKKQKNTVQSILKGRPIMSNAELFANGTARLLEQKFAQKRMTGWFEFQEIKMQVRESVSSADSPEVQADILCECVRRMKLDIPYGSVIAGTQDDAFSPSYALINPAFRIETFAGYCDPLAIYDDIVPDDQFPRERIEKVRSYFSSTPYVKALKKVSLVISSATCSFPDNLTIYR
jgi:formate C-acetyltransferase